MPKPFTIMTMMPSSDGTPTEGEWLEGRYPGAIFDQARELLGRHVKVYLGTDPDNNERVAARGKFIKIADSGEFIVQDEMGFWHYCWPMLDICETEEMF